MIFLTYLLTYLYEDHKFESIICKQKIKRQKNIVYIKGDFIENFSKPLFLSIIMDEPNLLVELINGYGRTFSAEHVSTSLDDRCATLLLHKNF